jgi:geranylgeranyl diphosphate synthase type I
MDELSAFRQEIDKAIMSYIPEQQPSDLYEAVRYLPAAGGKRLRPLMALLACQAVGGARPTAIPFGAALEIIHTFTLAHDDIMDRDEQRRGRPAVHTKFGESTAILAGDTLFAKAFEIVSASDLSPEVITALTHNMAVMSREICEGQQMDLRFEHEDDVAFQLWDDCLDLVGKDIGKPIGSDIREGKKTLVFIYAQTHATDQGWLNYHGNQHATPAQLQEVIQAFTDCRALDHATTKAHCYAEEAKNSLEILPDSKAKHILFDLAEFAVTRGI